MPIDPPDSEDLISPHADPRVPLKGKGFASELISSKFGRLLVSPTCLRDSAPRPSRQPPTRRER